MTVYLDTSAAMKLVVDEAESRALADAMSALQGVERIVSSWLLHAELHCGAARRPDLILPEAVSAVLDRLILFDLTRSDLLQAPEVGRGLRSQDALHLAAALRVGVDSILTYDGDQAGVATEAGLRVLQPS